MHEHKFRKARRIGNWRASTEPGIQIAYEELINICECGEQREIKTHPRGTWKRATTAETNRISTYPDRWIETLKLLLKNRLKEDISDIDFPTDTALKLSNMQWNEFKHLIDTLLRDGIIERFDSYPRASRNLSKIKFRADVVQSLKGLLGLDIKEKEKEKIRMFFHAWEYPSEAADSAVEKIATIIDKMKKAWLKRELPAVPVENSEIIMKSLPNYSLLLKTLREILNIADSHENITLRELSVRITGDSKGLESIRPYIREILGGLRDYGISEHSPLIFCRLPVIGKIGDKIIDMSACSDYVSMTVRTAESLIFTASKMEKLLLIENLTAFEKTARQLVESYDESIGIVFISGYPPGYIKKFTKKLIKINNVKGMIWCDLDPDGIEIALTAGKWFSASSWKPIFMEKDFLLSSKNKPLTDSDYKKLSLLKGHKDIGIFTSLLSEMERLGIKVEQEAQNISLLELKERLL